MECLLALNVDMWHFVHYREKNDQNVNVKEIIMRGLSKTDADKVRHYESAINMLSSLQCLHSVDIHIAQEEAKEPCCSGNEPEHGEVVTHHILADEEEVSEERPCCSESITSGDDEKDPNEGIFFKNRLISTLKDIKDLSKAIPTQEEKLKLYELENENLRKTLVDLNSQQEEASRLTRMLTHQLSVKEAYCERLQTEVVSLVHDLEK